MTALPGFPAVSGAATFQHIRRSLAGQVVKSAAGVLRKGILPISTANLVTGTATMNVAVGAFVAVLDRNGSVYVPNDGSINVLLSSAPASGSRWSVVYVKQRESEAPFSDGATGPIVDKVESTTSAAAARALIPTGGMELAIVQVNAGAATTNAVGVTITQTVPYTAMEGGVVLLRDATEQAAWVPHEGSFAHRLDTKQTLVYVDSTIGWVHAAGKPDIGTITPNTAGGAALGTPPARIIAQGGRIYLEGIITVSSATYNAGTTYGIGIAGAIPAAYWPKVDQRIPVSYNFIYFGELFISSTDGSISWRPASTLVGVPSIYLVGSWPDKRLV